MNKAEKEARIRLMNLQLQEALERHNEAFQQYEAAIQETSVRRKEVLDYVLVVGGEKYLILGEVLSQATRAEEAAKREVDQVVILRDQLVAEITTLEEMSPEPEVLVVSAEAVVDEIDMTKSSADAMEKTVNELSKVYRKQPKKDLLKIQRVAKKRYDAAVEEIARFDLEIEEAKADNMPATVSTLKMERRHFVAEMTDASVEYDAICEALDDLPVDEKSVREINHRNVAAVMALVAVLIAVAVWWLNSIESKLPQSIISAQKNTVAEANQIPDLPLEPIVKTDDVVIIQEIEAAKRAEYIEAEARVAQVLPPPVVLAEEVKPKPLEVDTLCVLALKRAKVGVGNEETFCIR